jgi:hypothetical protein
MPREPWRPTRGNVEAVLESGGEPVPAAQPRQPSATAGGSGGGDDPPEEITIGQLLSGKRRIFPVPWPTAPHITVGMRVLGRLEVTEAIAQARLDAKALANGGDADPIVIERCFRDHAMQLATCAWPPPRARDEEPEALFASVEEMRAKVQEPDIEGFYDAYAKLEKAVCPLQRAEFHDEGGKVFEEILTRLGKSEGLLILSVIPREALEALVRYMASNRGEPLPQTR